MNFVKGQRISKSEFLGNSEYAKEEYEGLLVAADSEKGYYQLAIEVGNDQVMLIDRVADEQVHARVNQLMPHIQEIQKQYKIAEDLGDYTQM